MRHCVSPPLRLCLLLFTLACVPVSPALAAPSPEQIKEVARDLVCLCGTCNRESLATCLCGTATSERDNIGGLLEAGLDRQQIVESYVERFGPMTLAQPPAGYDVVWIVPILMLVAGVFGVRQVLVYWRRDRQTEVQSPADLPGSVPATPAPKRPGSYDDRLRTDLDEFES